MAKNERVPECEICRAPMHENQDYCKDCQQAPILRQTFEEHYGKPNSKEKKKGFWR